jgi:hypothetical protein
LTPKDKPREGGRETTTPSRFPETTPQVYPGSDYSFTLQAVLELQKSVGQLQEAVSTLKDQAKQHSDKLEKISLRIYAATAVLVVLGSIIGFLLNKGVDLLIQIKGVTH